jgi:acetyl esterase/lipase
MWCAGTAVSASLVFSPRPAALLIRTVFAIGGARTARGLARHAPTDVVGLFDQRYGDENDMLLDVFSPQSVDRPLPLVVWIHGGGWVGGSKEELTNYLKIIASHGYVTVGPRYSLAPEHHYPTPLRQVMQALEYLQARAPSLRIDPDRVVIAGDSAGAQIAAQVGGMVTDAGYARAVGVTPTITATQLRGLVLVCGPYDLALFHQANEPAGQSLVRAMLWAYSGVREYLADPAFGTWSVTDHVSSAFPSTLITVGNADPLRDHSELLAERLGTLGVEVETVFWPDDHQPPLGHQYQFDLDTDSGRQFLESMLTFLRRRFSSP